MKIVVDDKIPYIQPPLWTLADEVVVKAGKDIGPEDVRDATILVVRTRTRCDQALLEGSAVKLVVTATIGYDHLDTAYLDAAGIEWHNCPGCNAESVAQYVHSCLLLLQRERGMRLQEATMGIIGVGHVGTAVMRAAQRLGIGRLLLNDPPREAAGERPGGKAEEGERPVGKDKAEDSHRSEALSWTALQTILNEADIISLHTPLTAEGLYPTLHLINQDTFAQMRRQPVIINAGRGGIIDEQALEAAMTSGQVREVILDTWEHEPHVSTSLLYKVYLGTPHIAGYSADGKANATRMTLTSICHFLHRPMTFDIQPPALPADFVAAMDAEELALQLYDPRRDSALLKDSPTAFEQLRGNYPLRREHL